jgi:hypothetical protein
MWQMKRNPTGRLGRPRRTGSRKAPVEIIVSLKRRRQADVGESLQQQLCRRKELTIGLNCTRHSKVRSDVPVDVLLMLAGESVRLRRDCTEKLHSCQ